MISIFIRTYEGDIEWLRYCLKSIHKNLQGWGEVLICIPEGQESLLKNIITTEKVVTCPVYKDDYIGQQISKLQAHKYVRGEFVLFVDSDVVFHQGAHTSDYFRDEKPIIVKDRYANLNPRLKVWQKVVKERFGVTPEFEYMRIAPQVFRKSTLAALDKVFPDMETHALNQPYRMFSEFNILGFFVEQTEKRGYHFIDVSYENWPHNHATQSWSWGGITPEVFAKFVQIGLADPASPPDYSQLPREKNRSIRKRLKHAFLRFLSWCGIK